MVFQREIVKIEMQIVSFRIWTCPFENISYDDNCYSTIIFLHLALLKKGKSHCVVANVLGNRIVESKFELPLCYNIHFRTHILEKTMHTIITHIYCLNSGKSVRQ